MTKTCKVRARITTAQEQKLRRLGAQNQMSTSEVLRGLIDWVDESQLLNFSKVETGKGANQVLGRTVRTFAEANNQFSP